MVVIIYPDWFNSSRPHRWQSRLRRGDAMQRVPQVLEAMRQIGGQQLPRLGIQRQKLRQGSWPSMVHKNTVDL